MTILAEILPGIIGGILAPLFAYRVLLLYQLSAYRLKELRTAVKRKRPAYFLLSPIAASVCFVVCAAVYPFLRNDCFAVMLALPLIAGIAAAVNAHLSAKVKLAFTARLKRFITVFAIIAAILSAGLTVMYPPLFALAPIFPGIVAFLFAAIITSPIEKRRNARFVTAAKTVLAARADLIKIGVTGSYGKTTAKNLLSAFLSKEYSTCVTPGNYNTPMGIALTVRDELLADDEVFVAEMGARYRGDIRELCDIVSPSIAVITAIGTQHLETFGSEENLLVTKNELIEALPADGVAIFNGDNDGAIKLYDRCAKRRLISGSDEEAVQKLYALFSTGDRRAKCKTAAGVKPTEEEVKALSRFDAFYGDICYAARGMEFTLVLNGRAARITTALLGAHVPSMIAECALTANYLGISLEKIKFAASEVKAVAHRLELLYNGDDVIIDDAYNGNEAGAQNALEVLSKFSPRIRVLITPGIVELGEHGEAANARIGELAAVSCDYAIFVGGNASALARGAKSAGMNVDNVTEVRDLDGAVEKLKTIKGEKAVLFENDLPDNY